MLRLEDVLRRRRRRALVIDHRIPMPDQDAGSRTIHQVLRLLAAKRFHVHLWAPEKSDDAPYRARLVAEGIRPHGLDPAPSPQFAQWLKRKGRSLDVVFVSRPEMVRAVLDLIREHSAAKVLFYGHDLHHLRVRMAAAQTGAPNLAARADAVEAMENAAWRKVDTVFYPSREECDYVRARCRATGDDVDARVLPVFGFDSFARRSDLAPDGRSGILFVGGFAHAPNVDGLLWFAREVWPAIASGAPDARLTIVGSRPRAEILALAEDRITVRGHVSDEALAEAYRGARVAVAPLRFGAGMKGKVVEAMRFGVPMVTTPIGAQGLEDAGDALHVSGDPARQAELVLALLRDDRLWRRTATAAVRLARRRFSEAALWAALSKAM